MAIGLGEYVFNESQVAVTETYEETGGRDGRMIRLKGALDGFASMESLEAGFDQLLTAASETAETALILRPGRRLWVRRVAFSREINRSALVGTFDLQLEAQSPFEESIEPVTASWAIGASGASQTFVTAGTACALPVIALTAAGNVVGAAFGDGSRTIRYPGVVTDGAVLVFDGPKGKITVSGTDVTPYGEGEFPRITPASNVLTYTDDGDSSHQASVTLAHRARWW